VATTVEPTGDTAESIVDAARKAQADLIVVGSLSTASSICCSPSAP
jgi:nucleotide-binding universal stress UspA family protein